MNIILQKLPNTPCPPNVRVMCVDSTENKDSNEQKYEYDGSIIRAIGIKDDTESFFNSNGIFVIYEKNEDSCELVGLFHVHKSGDPYSWIMCLNRNEMGSLPLTIFMKK